MEPIDAEREYSRGVTFHGGIRSLRVDTRENDSIVGPRGADFISMLDADKAMVMMVYYGGSGKRWFWELL